MKHKQKQKVKSLLNYALVIASLFLAFLGIQKHLKKSMSDTQKSSEADKEAPRGVDAFSLRTIAQKVSEFMGTAYPVYDPRRWFEKDKDAYIELKKIRSQAEFEVVSRMYKNVFAKGRDLSADLSKSLDNKYYTKLIFK